MTAIQFVLVILAGGLAVWAAAGGLGMQERLILILIVVGLVFAALKQKPKPPKEK